VNGDRLSVLTTAGPDKGKLATKRLTFSDGSWQIDDYSHAMWWSVRQVDVCDLLSLGDALISLERERCSCVIRGEPLPGIDPACTRRLKDQAEDGAPPSFAPAARRWLGIDFDSLPTPVWDPDKLRRRRAAIERDHLEHGLPAIKGPDDGEDIDLHADGDPAPISPVRDWAIVIRAAIITLPAEFHDASGYWQMTSSAGIKSGIRLRLWYWLDRPISDDEAKRWLHGAPIDTSLYGAVALHYTAAPIFEPPELDPVPLRSGFWWRHWNVVDVPDLTPPPKPIPTPYTSTWRAHPARGSSPERYAAACIDSLVAAPLGTGQGRLRLIAVARALYGMANAGLLDHGHVTAELRAAMANRGWTGHEAEIDRHLDWASAHADTSLPEGFR
jgi:hypothetical protein